MDTFDESDLKKEETRSSVDFNSPDIAASTMSSSPAIILANDYVPI